MRREAGKEEEISDTSLIGGSSVSGHLSDGLEYSILADCHAQVTRVGHCLIRWKATFLGKGSGFQLCREQGVSSR